MIKSQNLDLVFVKLNNSHFCRGNTTFQPKIVKFKNKGKKTLCIWRIFNEKQVNLGVE